MAEKKYPEQLLRLQEEHRNALENTDNEIGQWTKFKSDYEALKKRLHTLPDTLSQDVMIPFGKMAFIPGQIVHTNEILVLLGDNWFVERSAKQAAAIVDRRMESVDKQLEALNKQKQLLEPRQQFTSQFQQISKEGGEMKEIREEYDEEKEIEWKESHRKHVREYRKRRKKEAEKEETSLAEGSGQTRLTDEELWARLDQLEDIESERREVQKIGTKSEENLAGYTYPAFSHTAEDASVSAEAAAELDHSDTGDEESSYTASDELDSDDEDDAGSEETDVVSKGTLITFSHSKKSESHSTVLDTSKEDLVVTSPGDIYTRFAQAAKPKSILKKSPAEPKKKVRHKTKQSAVAFDTGSEEDKDHRRDTPRERCSLEPAFSGTVVEKSSAEFTPSSLQQVAPQRPMSKFKSQKANQNKVMEDKSPESANQAYVKPVSKFKAQRQNIPK